RGKGSKKILYKQTSSHAHIVNREKYINHAINTTYNSQLLPAMQSTTRNLYKHRQKLANQIDSNHKR
ncbi:MAG: hypothetical protein J6R02_00085, partial [Alistipes sp.]|nr:hypothetical protein [Alistipes sp.]